MYQYAKTELPKPFSVTSIVTLYYLDMQKHHPLGESHTFWEFMYVDKGEHHLTLNGKAHTLHEGQLIMYAPFSYHDGPPNTSRIGIVSFECESDKMDFFKDKIFTLNAAQRTLLSQLLTEGAAIFRQLPHEVGLYGILPEQNTPDYELQSLKNKLELFLIELYKAPEPMAQAKPSAQNQENYRAWQTNNVILFLKQHIGETVTLEQMAAQAGFSVSYLKKLFKQSFGCGPLTYFLLMKVEEAKHLICESSMNFTQIADALGFGSVHYFSRLFKEKTGLTPTEYAKSVYKK